MKLRQSSVNNINDGKYATLEPNGQDGFELKENKKPATKEDISIIIKEIQQMKEILGLDSLNSTTKRSISSETTLFTEVVKIKIILYPLINCNKR